MTRGDPPGDPVSSGGDRVWDHLDGLGADLVAASPLAIIGVDGAGIIRVFNPAAERLLGRRADGLLGNPVANLFPEDRAADSLAQIARSASSEDAEQLELELRTADDVAEIGMTFSAVLHAGQPVGTIGVGRDLSRRRALLHEVEQLGAGSRALAESSDVGMYRFSFHPELRVDHVNPALARSLGYTAEELLADASPFWTHISEEDAERFAANRRSAAPNWPMEFDWSRPDGSQMVFSVTEVPLRGPDGRLIAALGIARDVTAERRARAALTEALEMEREVADRLRRVDDLRRLFLQAVSHELRTPLTVIAGFAATLRDHVAELANEQTVQLSSRLFVQASKMQALLDDLLDIERTSRGVIHLEREALDVTELVRGIVDEERESGHVVGFTGGPAIASVDRIKVERIAANLLSNAHRHAGEDAVVDVRVDTAGDHVRLSVEDDGPGIPDELRARMFEAFEQGPTARGAPSPGTGIGLALVAAFTGLHGGTVAIEDGALGGARLVVRLPVGRW